MKTKEQIITELAKSAGITPEKCEAVLKELNLMAYREAENGFEIPALCKFQVIKLSSSPTRAPLAGGQTEIKERKLLKVDALKEARDAILNPPPVAVQPVILPSVEKEIEAPAIEKPAEEELAPEPVTPDLQQIPAEETPIPEPIEEMPAEDIAVAVEEPLPPVVSAIEDGPVIPLNESEEPTAVLPDEIIEAAEPAETGEVEPAKVVAETTASIIFKCEACGDSVEAPGDMAGMDGECPFCGMVVKIPAAIPEEPENAVEFDPMPKSQLPHYSARAGASADISPKKTSASFSGLPAKSTPNKFPQKPEKQSPYMALDKTIRIDLPADILNPHQEVDRKKIFIKRR